MQYTLDGWEDFLDVDTVIIEVINNGTKVAEYEVDLPISGITADTEYYEIRDSAIYTYLGKSVAHASKDFDDQFGNRRDINTYIVDFLDKLSEG